MTGKMQSTGLRRLVNALRYSLDGIAAAVRHEAAFRQELVLCLVMVPLAFLVGNSAVEYVLLVCSCLLVLVVELINSAIEAIVDRVGTDRHALSGRAKDMGSAAVLVSLAMVIVCWGLIGYDNFIR